MDEDHYAINRAFWDERAPAHAGSADYAVQEIIADPTRLSDVIRFDLPRLGDVNGLRGIHLQCHIGTDTISLQRLGAAMTGLDFSAASIAIARRIATDARADVAFVESDVYSAPVVVGDGFDFVFTGIGALCWLPDIQRWARTVADLLRPGGRLFLREGHPVMWGVDEDRTDALVLSYPYFERPGLEPWPWGNRHRCPGGGPRADHARRARLGAVGRVAGAHAPGRRRVAAHRASSAASVELYAASREALTPAVRALRIRGDADARAAARAAVRCHVHA
jgi:SAM-dependent methyltransferase